MAIRACVLAVLVLAAGGWARTSGPRDVAPPVPLSSLPLRMGVWRGADGPAVSAEVARVLRADEYVNRVYQGAAGAVVGLWVAFYASQRQGDAIHSPLNCLPGTGWTPLQHSRVAPAVNGQALPMNRYLVQKRGERQLVLYWYQGRGRVIASEYTNKAYLLVDAVTKRRTDGALVRVTVPVLDGERQADRAALTFIEALQPQLARGLP
jgi:EpsI family protein